MISDRTRTSYVMHVRNQFIRSQHLCCSKLIRCDCIDIGVLWLDLQRAKWETGWMPSLTDDNINSVIGTNNSNYARKWCRRILAESFRCHSLYANHDAFCVCVVLRCQLKGGKNMIFELWPPMNVQKQKRSESHASVPCKSEISHQKWHESAPTNGRYV